MNARTWLNRAKNIDREIDGLIQIRDEAVRRALSVTQSFSSDVVQSTKDPHKFDRIAELEDEINQRIDALLCAKAEINAGISKLNDGRYREILRLRYLGEKRFEEISVAIHYSYKQTCRMHGRALLLMEEIINERRT